MRDRQILFASTDSVAPQAEELFKRLDERLSATVVGDGANGVHQFVRLVQSGMQPILCIIDFDLPGVNGTHLALSIRAIERGLGLSGSAMILRCTSTESSVVSEIVPQLGRSVQLTRRNEYSEEQQLRRLVKASDKVLAQLKGRS